MNHGYNTICHFTINYNYNISGRLRFIGPFSNWIHSHRFKEVNGGTIIVDHVEYSMPLGFIGEIANYIFVEKDLVDIFDYREKTIMEIFNNHYDLCLEI